ncbi:hypothetical protein Cv017_22630 [Chromobacterium subtsugae]|nr:hypothetical protein Cv017_22630 [Chromobacterium subtsugae]
MYRLPEHYLVKADAGTTRADDQTSSYSVGGAPAKRSVAISPPQIDLETLQMVETVLDQVLQERNLRLKSEKRGAVVAFLYDYASKGGGRDGMLMALQALVA